MNTKKYTHITLKAFTLLAALAVAMLAWSATLGVNRLAAHTSQLRAENRHLKTELAEAYNIIEQTHTDNAHN